MASKPRTVLTQEEIEEQEKLETNERNRRRVSRAAVLSTPEGKAFCREIITESMVFTSTFTGNSMTYFNEGMRNTGLILFNKILDLVRNDLLPVDSIMEFLPEVDESLV